MEMISYIASFISTVLGLCEPFGKKMSTILAFNFMGNLLVGLSYLCIKGYSGAAICFVACFQVSINYLFDVKGKKLPVWLVIVHAVVFLLVNLITFAKWFDVLALLAAFTFVLSVAQNNAKYYRFLYITNSFLWIIYDVLAHAYGNLFTHTALFVGIAVAIYIRDRKVQK